MLFSILIPVYNAAAFLRECLQSIVKQTCDDFEVWMINDGSKDSSGAICNEYAEKYSNFHVIHQNNNGTIMTRAALVEKAQGEYCLFVDADDYIRGDMLEVLRRTLQQTNAECIVFGFQRVQNGQCIEVVAEPFSYEISSRNEMYTKLLSTTRYNSLCTKCIRTSKLKGFSADPYKHFRLGEDLIQSLYAYKQFEKVVFIPDVLYYYVMNPTSTTHTISKENFRSCYMLYDTVMCILGDAIDKNSSVAEAIRSNYAQYLTLDILSVEKFELCWTEKVALLREMACNCAGIFNGAVSKVRIGKRYPLYVLLKYGFFRCCLMLAWLVNKKNRAH